MLSGARDASCGGRFGEAVWLDGRERRVEGEEIDKRELDAAGGGIGGKKEEDRSDEGVAVSSIMAVAD